MTEPQNGISDREFDHERTSKSPSPNTTVIPTHIVGIGASAGGLEALERLFQYMPADTGMAFVVVQHLSPDFKSLMDELLARWTSMPVHAVEDQMVVAANQIYLMAPKTEIIISDGKLLLTARERTDELRLPIDQFFRSLARDCGSSAIAIVLSGTGSDGSRGIRDIKEGGGYVIVQSEETAKFDGMPKSAVDTGVVDAILAPEEMPTQLLRLTDRLEQAEMPVDEATGMTPIFGLLRQKFGIDFSHYKPSTVARRTDRRLQLSQTQSLEDYVAQLKENPEELNSLYRDLLIGVTSFFRDPGAFQILQHDIIPRAIEKLNDRDEFRVWVAGCATGEEAYSLAIIIHEHIQKIGKQIEAKIFATDVHAPSLEFAAQGLYKTDSIASVTPERLKNYFLETSEGFRVTSELRNMIVFAPHNIIRDAPFTRLDLISCRNLLIYLVAGAQQKALSLFHFGLKTGGTLLLGPSESPGQLASEFERIDEHWKVFRKRRDVHLPADLRLPLSAGPVGRYSSPATLLNRRIDSPLGEIFEKILDQSLPPSVLVNEQMQVVHTFGDAAKFLRLRKGMPSLLLSDMLNEQLKIAVGAAIHRAKREKKVVSFSNVKTNLDDAPELVDLTIIPYASTRHFEAHTLVKFEESRSALDIDAQQHSSLADATRDHAESLEAELRFARESLQATIEELETSNEELQATNEELLASNEELQSTNEELHSVNEELFTVNSEYQKKIEEQTEFTQDLNNLLRSTDVHTIFLDENLCIRKFTPKMAEVFNLIDADVGRRIHGFVHTINCIDLAGKLELVANEGVTLEEEVENNDGDQYLMRILPYLGDASRKGVVMTLIDITVLKAAEGRFKNAVEVSPNGMLVADSNSRIVMVNSEIERMFGYQSDELIGQTLEVLLPKDMRSNHAEKTHVFFDNPHVIRRMGDASVVWAEHKDGSRIPLDVRVNPIETPTGTQAIASLVDVSEHQKLEESLRFQVKQRDRFLATLSHELRNPMGAILTAASLLNRVANGSNAFRQPCEVIGRQATHIATLLDDLLDVARVTQGKIKLRLEPVNVQDVCRESLEAVATLTKRKKHEVIFSPVEGPLWVEVERVRLLQIVENLLTNAIKYTPDHGQIQLDVRRDSNWALIEVRDNGCGMSPELLGTVFDMFVQSDQTLDRSEGGMGVGLTLVRSLVELHAGTIQAFSDGVGKGSRFVVKLPLTNKRPDRAKEERKLQTAPQDIRIVLVEDNDDTREMLKELLLTYGYDVVATAPNGVDGLEQIQQHRPDAALLDIGLPGLDGFQVARKVREKLGDEVLLFALTGYGTDEDRGAVVEAGFNEHLVKPVSIKHLSRLLNHHMRK